MRWSSASAVCLLLSGQVARPSDIRKQSGAPELIRLDGDLSPVHDPVIIKEKDTWYLFCTGGSIRRSNDLHHWTLAGKVFDKLPEWAITEIPGTRGGFWAPDISFHNGVYRLYYAVSTFGKNDSAIGLATSKTLDQRSPDYKWIDQGLVFRSHKGDDFNAIDPNLAVDQKGRQWLDFGSFWGGIKMIQIDKETGKPSRTAHKIYSLASRFRQDSVSDTAVAAPPKNSIEAAFIVRRGRFFYLFVSFDYCCKGANSTYNVVVGRSREITGPYRDRAGRLMAEGGGTRLTTGTSLWRGPGHAGVLLQQGSPDLVVFHAYDATSGKPFLQISTLTWENDWPEVAALPGGFIPNSVRP
ncbi:MAG: arabinan endo-1,5-alpha-L-arabinosidase [Bryobacteraceae bacterium]